MPYKNQSSCDGKTVALFEGVASDQSYTPRRDKATTGPGYQQVPLIGWVPNSWGVKPIKATGRVVTGSTPPTRVKEYYGGDYPFVSPGDLGDFKEITRTEKTLTELGFQQTRHIPQGSVLFTCISFAIGKTGLSSELLATNQQINAVIPNQDHDGEYLYYVLTLMANRIKRLAGLQATPILNKTAFENIKLAVPSLPEQRKIARILGAWDRALVQLDGLIKAKQSRFQGLLQRLLKGQVRFPEFQGQPWHAVQLGDVTRESRRRNNGQLGEEALYGVNKFKGMIPNQDRVQSDDISRYKFVQPKAFAYNPMRLNIGSIARLEEDQPVLVSPDYIVFECIPGELDSDYFNHFRQGYEWNKFVERAGSGSVRVRIYYRHLKRLKLRIPPIKEQQKIALVLNAARAELEILQQKRNALAMQKKGLMQRLLTGQIRVKPDEQDYTPVNPSNSV